MKAQTKKAVKKPVAKSAAGKKPAAKKALSPLEKARLARSSGKAKAKKPQGHIWTAPADFKPFFIEVGVRTDKDGLLGSSIKAIRYQGRYDVNAEDKKKFDIAAYDVPTLVGIQSRLSAKTFKTNPTKIMPAGIKERNLVEKIKKEDGTIREKLTFASGYRLPANASFYVVLRVSKRKADNALMVGLKQVDQIAKIEKAGVKKSVRKTLDKKDPAYRLLMSAKRYLPAAFKEVLLPPKRTRGANKKQEAEE